MFQILLTGLCLAAAFSPIAAQLQQKALESQPTNYLIGAQANPVGVRYPQPPPPPPGSWPAPPPPPIGPPPTPNDCTDPGSPLGACPENSAQSVYLASTNCECFFQCSNGVPVSQPCPSGLYFNPTLKVCDFPQNSGCTMCRVGKQGQRICS